MKNSKQTLIRLARILADLPVIPFAIVIIFFGIVFGIFTRKKMGKQKPCLLWASSPIKSLAYMSRAMSAKGYKSECVVLESSPICTKTDFDYVLMPQLPQKKYFIPLAWMLANLRSYFFFAKALSRYDIFHFYFDGGILRRTLLAPFELKILKLLNKRIVLMPYGSDAFVYDAISDPVWRHVLMAHYPMFGDQVRTIQKRIRRMTAEADIVVGCLVHIVNLPRWDILPLTCYPIDTQAIHAVLPKSEGKIRIAHAPNHRVIKGTEYLEAAIKRLQEEGYEIELDIIEKVPNSEALQRIAKADIFVDQLIFGFALAALEGLAMGKIVISAIEDNETYKLFRHYSYLNECPIVPATITSIYDVLKNLIQQRNQWQEIGLASRAYAERRHSFAASAKMFEAIYQKIWWREEVDLINFYHPLLEIKS